MVVLVLALLAGVYASLVEIPDFVLQAVIDRLRFGIFALEARGARLDPLRGVQLAEVRVYRQGVAGPPVAEAQGVLVALNPLARLRGEVMVRRVVVETAVARPRLLEGPDRESVRPEPLMPSRISVDVRRAVAHGVDVQDLHLDIRAHGWVTEVDRIQAAVRRQGRQGEIRARAVFDMRTRHLSGHLRVEADPRVFLLAMADWDLAGLAGLVRETDFRETPSYDVDYDWILGDGSPFDLRGRFSMSDFSFRGVPLLRADGQTEMRLSRTNSSICVRSGLLVREEGVVRGGFTLWPREQRIIFDGFSAIDPKMMGLLTGIVSNDVAPAVRFRGPVRIDAEGEVRYGDPDRTRIAAFVQGGDLAVQQFTVDRYQFALRMEGRTCMIEGLKGKIYGGPFWGDARLDLPGPDSPSREICYGVNVAYKDGSFGALMTEVLREEGKDYSGDFSGVLRADGMAGSGKGKTVLGDGIFRVRRGRVFLLPVFGGLSEVMTRLIPGLEFVLRQSDATVNFEMADGKVKAQKVGIEGEVLSLSGRGDYGFAGDVDFDVQLTLMKEHTAVAKVLRMLTYPISKLMEFRVRGTFSNPAWYPVNFSKDLLKRLGLEGLGSGLRRDFEETVSRVRGGGA
jgi:hypothetical protein